MKKVYEKFSIKNVDPFPTAKAQTKTKNEKKTEKKGEKKKEDNVKHDNESTDEEPYNTTKGEVGRIREISHVKNEVISFGRYSSRINKSRIVF